MGLAKYAEEIRETYYERMEELEWRRTSTCCLIPSAAVLGCVCEAQKRAAERREGQEMKIQCQDCGDFFLFSAKEQRFYTQKGFSRPKRCKACREMHQVLAIGFGR